MLNLFTSGVVINITTEQNPYAGKKSPCSPLGRPLGHTHGAAEILETKPTSWRDSRAAQTRRACVLRAVREKGGGGRRGEEGKDATASPPKNVGWKKVKGKGNNPPKLLFFFLVPPRLLREI